MKFNRLQKNTHQLSSSDDLKSMKINIYPKMVKALFKIFTFTGIVLLGFLGVECLMFAGSSSSWLPPLLPHVDGYLIGGLSLLVASVSLAFFMFENIDDLLSKFIKS